MMLIRIHIYQIWKIGNYLHNGTIENYQPLKQEFTKRGFKSDNGQNRSFSKFIEDVLKKNTRC
jgi:glucosamine 6-phosphate synthetase-like amidotransferase/phosphosugar isomerase protein